MAQTEAPPVAPESPAPGVLAEGVAPPADRKGDVGLMVFGVVWAVVVIAVGMWLQG
jgi:hypothetical protein